MGPAVKEDPVMLSPIALNEQGSLVEPILFTSAVVVERGTRANSHGTDNDGLEA